MAKGLALKDYIEIDGVDLSNDCRAFTDNFAHASVDVSGFSATGNDESIAGATTQEVSIDVFMNYAAGRSFQTLWPLFRDRSIVTLKHRPDQTAGVSATNPQLVGNVQLLTWPPGATRGDVRVATFTFTSADSTGLGYIYT